MAGACSGMRYLARSRPQAGSGRMGLLARFYPYKKLRTRDVFGDGCGYDFVSKQVRDGLLERAADGGASGRRTYRLTCTGRISVMRDILGVSFLCMCILAEAYVVNTY